MQADGNLCYRSGLLQTVRTVTLDHMMLVSVSLSVSLSVLFFPLLLLRNQMCLKLTVSISVCLDTFSVVFCLFVLFVCLAGRGCYRCGAPTLVLHKTHSR